MKMVMCDKYGEVDEEGGIYNMDYSGFYVGKITEYGNAIELGFTDIDLCRKCQAELNEIIKEFMKTPIK